MLISKGANVIEPFFDVRYYATTVLVIKLCYEHLL